MSPTTPRLVDGASSPSPPCTEKTFEEMNLVRMEYFWRELNGDSHSISLRREWGAAPFTFSQERDVMRSWDSFT